MNVKIVVIQQIITMRRYITHKIKQGIGSTMSYLKIIIGNMFYLVSMPFKVMYKIKVKTCEIHSNQILRYVIMVMLSCRPC